MGQAGQKHRFTAVDYLAWEPAQAEHHEYIDGEVFAMAGAEDRHVTVSMNLAFALRQHLSGSPCRAFMSDMRLHVAAANSYFYLDVLVTCSTFDLASTMVKTEPTLIAEVLSPSTGADDRGLKFSPCRRIASLQEYVLVDLDTRIHRLSSKRNRRAVGVASVRPWRDSLARQHGAGVERRATSCGSPGGFVAIVLIAF